MVIENILTNKDIKILDKISFLKKENQSINIEDINFKIIQNVEKDFYLLINKAYLILYDIYILHINEYEINIKNTIKDIFTEVCFKVIELYFKNNTNNIETTNKDIYYVHQNIYMELLKDFFENDYNMENMILKKINISHEKKTTE